MRRLSSAIMAGVVGMGLLGGATGLGFVVGGASSAHAQSRTPPAGSSLALTPPIDQRRKQYRALPKTQRKFYKLQGYKKYRPPK